MPTSPDKDLETLVGRLVGLGPQLASIGQALNPNFIDNLRIITYLEHLFDPADLEEAKRAMNEKLESAIDELQSNVRRARLTSGLNGTPPLPG